MFFCVFSFDCSFGVYCVISVLVPKYFETKFELVSFNIISIIYVYFTFLIFIFYHFSHIKIKEAFVTNSFREIELFKYRIFFRMNIHIVCNVSRVCLLFTFFSLSFIFCSRLETFLMIFDRFQEIGFVFKHVSACRIVDRIPSPCCYSMRDIETRRDIIRWFVVAIRSFKFSRDVCSI